MKFADVLAVFFVGPAELKAFRAVPGLWKVEALLAFHYLRRFMPLDIWLQGRPLVERPFGDFRYGETPYHTALEILREARLEAGETFMDMGCGRGKMVFTAALACQAHAVGVELLPTYHRIARKISTALQLDDRVEFWLQDFTLVEVFQADVIYIAGSIFEEVTRQELIALVEQLQPGSRWITVGWASEHPLLQLESSICRLFSWGRETVYQYVVTEELIEAPQDFHRAILEKLQLAGSPADAIADEAGDPQDQVAVVLEDEPGDPAADLASPEDAPVVPGAVEPQGKPPEQAGDAGSAPEQRQ